MSHDHVPYAAVNRLTNSIAPPPRMTISDRLIKWLFPYQHCHSPVRPPHWQGDIRVEVFSHVSFADRLRILISGRCKTVIKIVCEHKVGGTNTNSEFYVIPPRMLTPKKYWDWADKT